MLRLIKETHIDFMGLRRQAFVMSMTLIVIGILVMAVRGGLRMGVDFTGGVQVEVGVLHSEEAVDIGRVRDAVAAAGYDSRSIQRVGGRNVNNFLIHVKATAGGEEVTGREAATDVGRQTSDNILVAMRREFGEDNIELRGNDSVGPKIGAELRKAAIEAILLSMLLVMAYIAWRFEFRFGVATLVAVFHDVFVVLGLFALFNKEMTLSIVAALLTLVGYSVNDTIIVFDRIREELKRKQRRENVESIFNTGINQTLSRTLLTSLTTLIVVMALFIYGGDVIHDFCWVLLIGIIVGTYSSIFIAAPLVVEWQKRAALRDARRAA